MTSFDAVYTRHRSGLMKLARSLTFRSNYDADDLFQETMMSAWRSWSKLSTFENVYGALRQLMRWTWRIVMESMTALRRNGGTSPIALEDMRAEPFVRSSPDALLALIDVERELQTMRPKMASRIIRYAQGHTMREIADDDGGITHQAVQNAVSRFQSRMTEVWGA
jgi:DNA-directed RNA polymerase specialized sigma24 family protein